MLRRLYDRCTDRPARQVYRQACVEINIKFPFNASWARLEVLYLTLMPLILFLGLRIFL